ncbi:MAG: family N-acetyltransferase [Acidobacteriales bacterium]|nr:family N-acetyltransferase [Terriglobales bacterium]
MIAPAPLALQSIRLTGTRAELVPLEVSHIEALYEAGRDPQAFRYFRNRMTSVEDMRTYMMEGLATQTKGTDLPWVILDREQGNKVVGSTRLFDVQLANRNGEIGHTWLNPSVWRTRINTECKYMILRHCFETLNFLRVQLKTDLRNVRSQEAIARLGAVREGVWRNHVIMHDGYIRSSVVFSVLAEEWPGVKGKLEEALA